MTPAQLRDLATPIHARSYLSPILSSRLNQWDTPLSKDSEVKARDVARDAIAIYDRALTLLDKKTGPRTDAARAAVTAARAPIAAALELANALGPDFDGKLGRELQQRVTSTRAALMAALNAKDLATRATVDQALLEVERCLADCRELDRDLVSINDQLSVRFLQWPNLDDLRKAEASTQALEELSSKNPKAIDVHGAIEQGLEAPAAAAVLFAAYETQPDHPLIKWRAQALAERG